MAANPVRYIQQKFNDQLTSLYNSDRATEVSQFASMQAQVEPTNNVDQYGRSPEADAITKSILGQEAAKDMGSLNGASAYGYLVSKNVESIAAIDPANSGNLLHYYLDTDTGKVFMRTIDDNSNFTNLAPDTPVDARPPPQQIAVDLVRPDGSFMPISNPDTKFTDVQWNAISNLTPSELSAFEAQTFGNTYDPPSGYVLNQDNMYIPVDSRGLVDLHPNVSILPENLAQLSAITYQAYGVPDMTQYVTQYTDGKVSTMFVNPTADITPTAVLSGSAAASYLEQLTSATMLLPQEVYQNGRPVVVQMYPTWLGVSAVPASADTSNITMLNAQGVPQNIADIRIFSPDDFASTFIHEFAHAQEVTDVPADVPFMNQWGYNAYGDGYNDIYRGATGATAIQSGMDLSVAPSAGFANSYGANGGINEDWATTFDAVVNRPQEVAVRELSDPVFARKVDMVEAALYQWSGGIMDAQYWNDRATNYSQTLSAEQAAARNAYLRNLMDILQN